MHTRKRLVLPISAAVIQAAAAALPAASAAADHAFAVAAVAFVTFGRVCGDFHEADDDGASFARWRRAGLFLPWCCC